MAPAAKADSFNLTFTGGLTGGLYIGGSSAGGGTFDITSGGIMENGVVGSLIPVAASGPNGFVNITVADGVGTYYYHWPNAGENVSFDNVLTFPGTPYMTSNGFLFALPNSGLINIWYDPGGSDGDVAGYYYNVWNGNVNSSNFGWEFNLDIGAGGAPLTFNITETPEPSSLLLLGTGLLLMAGFLFRKSKPGIIQSV